MRFWDKSKPPSGPWTLNKDSEQAQGLMAWWPLLGGNTHTDIVGGANGSGAIVSRTLGIDGQPAVALNGTSEYINIGSGKFPFLKTSAFCLFARVVTTSTAKAIICNWQVGTQAGWQWITNTGGVHGMGFFDFNGVNGYSSQGGNVTDGKQHDLFVSHSGSATAAGIQSYVDGRAVSMTTSTSGTGDPGALVDNVFQIGARNGALFMPGTMSDVRVYSDANNAAARALSISDPETKYELLYPLRSRKWFVAGAAGGFQTAWAVNANSYHSQGASHAA